MSRGDELAGRVDRDRAMAKENPAPCMFGGCPGIAHSGPIPICRDHLTAIDQTTKRLQREAAERAALEGQQTINEEAPDAI